MSTVRCLKSSSCQMYEKFSPKKLIKLVKVVKPVLKLIRKRQRTNAVTPSTCNYDIVESVQNDANESELFRLDFKFFEETEESENERNEQIERELLKKLENESVRGYEDKFGWAPRSDVDICMYEYVTCRQRAEMQTPVAMA